MDNDGILRTFLDVSIALSVERNTDSLLESILMAARTVAHADSGTIYSVNDERELVFDTLFNDSLNLHIGGSSQVPPTFAPIPMYVNGDINREAVVAHAGATGEVVNIADIYQDQRFNFARAKEMDEHNGYHTQSMLTIPMQNHEGELIGVMQLINAQKDGQVVSFDDALTYQLRALTSLTAVALTNRQLIDDMEELFQAFTQLIAKAIDEKSPYTGGHCRRVPVLTMMIAEAVHRHQEGPMAAFTMTEADRHELNLAGWIHDCGKVATPEYVMDKATKLETVFDRIHLVDTRFELCERELELAHWKALTTSEDPQAEQARFEQHKAQLLADREFVRTANTGGEFMAPEDQQRLIDIGKTYQVSVAGVMHPLLSDEEVYNLQTARGTLNPEERATINRHMDITVEMLEALPFPKHLARVPEFAGGHHEKMDGTGYPKKLTRDQMSIPARIMAIADIFEALTAADRPYKDAKKISECLSIMGKMKLGHHIDPDLFDVFVKEKVYEEYAQQFLKPEQMDDINIDAIPGFNQAV